jgi:acyl carrier protein
VVRLVAGTLGLPEDQLNIDSSMDDTPAWDSSEHMNICMAFEQQFGKKLTMDDITSATSIRALIALVP